MAPKDDSFYQPRFRRLEERLLLNATPEAAVVDLPTEELINEDFEFSISFDNTATAADDVGFGPFVDVTVGPGIEVNDVTFLGNRVSFETVGVWDGTDWIDSSGNPVIDHPLDTVGGLIEIPVGVEIGETWLNVLAPFGSYTPDQPAIELDFAAELAQSPDGIAPGAVPGQPITVTARGGFQFGEDALNNPTVDPPLQQGNTPSDTITPIVLKLEKLVQLPESETAQGPNFPFTYTISVDIANGASVSDIKITDILPQNLFILGTSTNIATDSITAPGDGANPDGVPGRDTVTTAEFVFADTSFDPNAAIIGEAGDGEIVITIRAFAPDLDSLNDLIIDPDAPTSAIATNTSTITANFEGNPIDDTNSGALSDNVDIAIRPYTVLKSVAVEGGGPAVPGEFLEFTIDVDLSDFQGIQDLVLNDVLSDGLTLDTTDNGVLEHTPVFRGSENGVVLFVEFEEGNQIFNEIELETNFAADGSQELTFFISNTLRNNGGQGLLAGDLFLNDGQQGATTFTLTYFAKIEETFREVGRGSVVNNDGLTNSVSLAANSQTSGNAAEPDSSASGVTISPPVSAKSIFAVNGVQGAQTNIAPGDDVTYRLRLSFDSLDTNNLTLEDFLPAPVYDVDANGTGFTFVDVQGTTPAPFTIIRGPDDTATGASGVAQVPTVVTSGNSNSILISFPDFEEDASGGGVIDLLYTITATDQPFADGLLLVNQAIISTGSSTAAIANEDTIVGEVTLRQPVLSLTKGIVATDADGGPNDPLEFDPIDVAPSNLAFALGTPGFSVTSPLSSAELAATPIVSDLAGFDAGDTVKFAIAIANTGGQDGFDIQLADVLPTGFLIPTSFNLDVRYGDGTEILFDATPDGSAVSYSGDLFNSALIINDPTGTGAIGADGLDDGSNIIIVSYELIAGTDFNPGVTVTNAAELLNFAAIEGGNNFTTGVDGQFTDEADLTSQSLNLDKRLIATDQTFTDGNDLAIGEIATFLLEVTVPDGETPATVLDDLPDGLAIVGSPILRTTFTNSSGASQTFLGSLEQSGAGVSDGDALAFTTNGNDITIDFSSIIATAAAGTDLTGQVFAIEYQVRATDDPALSAGDSVSNTATVDTPTTDPTDPASVIVDIVEPQLSLTKTFTPDVADGDDIVGLVLLVENATGNDQTTSFGLDLTDNLLPTDIFDSVVSTGISGTGNVDAGKVTVTIDATGDPNFFLITVTGDDDFAIAPGESLSLSFDLTVQSNVALGSTVINTATIETYTSLPGIVVGERTFGPEEATDTLSIEEPDVLKFLADTSFKPGNLIDPDPNVFVGEIVTYEVSARFPEGVAQQVRFLDDTELFAGQAFGAVEVLSISNFFVGGGLEITGFTDLDGDGLLTAADAIIADTDGNGVINQVLFELGTVDSDPLRNNSPIPLSTIISFTLRAQILNVPEADNGDIHQNLVRVEGLNGDGTLVRVDDLAETTIREPIIDIQKTATTVGTTLDAGDIVTYSLTVSHDGAVPSGAPGFDLSIVDVLPNELALVANSATVTAFTAPGFDGLEIGDVLLDLTGNRVVVENFDLPLGQTAVITYQARVLQNVVAGLVIDNDAELTYASLPDSDAGASERRDGSGVDFTTFDPADPPRFDTTILNNYGDLGAETITITEPGGIQKVTDRESASVAIGEYTIGEEIIYTIDVPVIEGQTIDAVLVDQLPTGLALVTNGGAIVDAITAVNGDGTVVPITSATISQTAAGQTIRLEFGTISNPGDNDPSNDFIRVSFNAQVLNLIENKNGDTKENLATFSSDNQPDRSDTADILVIEPELELTKTSDLAGPFDAGDVITYTLTAEHSAGSTADAFEFDLEDSLPGDVEFVQLVSAEIDGVDVSAQVILDGDTLRSADSADLDILIGAKLTVVYETRVKDEVNPGGNLTNQFTGIWTSLDGDVRTGAIGGERTGNLLRDANDNIDVVQLNLPVDTTLDIAKTVASIDSRFAIGETVTYFLDIEVFEGTTRAIAVVDLLDPGVSIDLSSLRVIDVGFAGAPVSIINPLLGTVPGFNDSILSFELDNTPGDNSLTVVNPGDPFGDTTDNDTIRIAYEGVVSNVISSQNLTDIDNVVVAAAINTDVAQGAASIEIVEPKLSLAKTNDATGPIDAGDVVTFTLDIAHVSTATNPLEVSTSDAFDLQLTDVVPADLRVDRIVSAEIDGTDVSAAFEIVGGEVRIRTAADVDLLLTENLIIVYEATALSSVSPGETLTNTVDMTWTSTDGANADERDGSDGIANGTDLLNDYAIRAQSTVVTGGNLEIDKGADRASGAYAVGETITYTLDIEVFEGTLTNVEIADLVDPGLEIVLGSIAVVDIGFDGDPVTVTAATLVGDSVVGTTLSFAISNASGGRLVNNGDPAGNTDDNDTVRVTYQAIVKNQLSSQDGVTIDNAVGVASAGGLSDAASAQVSVIEPEIEIDKQVLSPAGPVDAGDLIVYQVVLTNTGTADAFDLTFADSAPANSVFTGTVSAVDGNSAPTGTFVIAPDGLTLSGSAFDIAINETVTITYTLEVANSIVPGDQLINTANVEWTSTSGANSDERDGTDGPGDDTILNNYAATDTETVDTNFAIGLSKAISNTSLNDDTDPDVVIGEVVTWALELELTEGTTPNVVIVDQLSAGMIFTGDVTVTPPAGVTVTFDNPNPVVIDPVTGAVTIDLGNVTVAGTPDASQDADTQIITLSYQTIIGNVLTNQDGVALPNTATVTATGGLTATDTSSVSIIEPVLEIAKVNDAATAVQAGDTVTFTINARHSAASTSTAFDFELVDTVIPTQFRIDNIISATLGGVDVSAEFDIVGSSLVTLATADLDLAVGDELELIYQVIVQDTVGPQQTLPNVVVGTWTSLDGDVDSGEIEGERDGTLARDVNDYIAFASSQVQTDQLLELIKTIDAPDTNFAIGEVVPFLLDVTVFEGTLLDVVVADFSDPGIEIDLSTLRVIDNGFAGLPVQIFDVQSARNPVTGDLVISFLLDNDFNTAGSQIVNPGDGDPTNNTIRIAFEGTVLNELINQDGTGISDVAAVSAIDSTAALDSAGITVVEPEITLDKSLVVDPGVVDAGDVLDYQVTLVNSGTSTAFDVVFSDAAPGKTVFTGAVVAVNSSGAAVGNFQISADGLTLTGDTFDILVGETVTVTYSITVADSVSTGDQFTNTAVVDWTSLSGVDAGERDGSDGPGPDATVLNNYAAVDQITIPAADFTVVLDKVVEATSVSQTSGTDVSVGELVTYRVRIALTEGTTQALVLRDVLPDGLRFIDGTVQITPGNPGATVPFNPGSVSILANSNTLEIPIGDVVNPGDNDPTNDFLDVVYQVVVEDDSTFINDGSTLINTVSAFTNTGLNDTDTAQVDVIEPDLVVTKNANAAFVPFGNDITYEVRVSHSAQSSVAAFDLVVDDPFGTGFATLNPASITAVIQGVTGLPAPVIDLIGTGFRITVPELTLGAVLVISYDAAASTDAAANGEEVDNEATLNYDTIPGMQDPDEQRSYQDADQAQVVIVGPDLKLIKDVAVPNAVPGDTFDYTIQVLNKGVPNIDGGDLEIARNVLITDTLPPDLTLLSVTVDGIAVTPAFVAGTQDFTIDLGDVPDNVTKFVTLTVQVASPVSAIDDDSAGTDLLINVASVALDQLDPTPEDNIDDASVPLIAVPDLVVTKTNAVEETGGSEVVTFTLTASNVGDRIAADVLIIDRVDTTVFQFVSATNGGVFDAGSGTVTWRFDRLSPDDGEIALGLTLKVLPNLPATVDRTTNLVDISDNGRGGTDPTPENNSDSHTDRLIYPDLVITKSNAVDEVSPGDLIEFTITASNIGDFKADGIQVVDVVDTSVFAFVSASDGGAFNATNGTVTWALGTINPGDAPRVLTVILEVQFPDNSAETAVNVVAIKSDGTRGLDSDLTNNIAEEIDILNAAPDPFEIAYVFREDVEDEEEEEEPILFASPLFTGIGPAGATINLVLIGADGTILQSGTTIAATDGTWFISIPDVAGSDQPVSAVVTTFPAPLGARDSLAGSNVFLSPGDGSPIVFERSFDVFSRNDLDSAEVLQQRILASEAPGAISARQYVNFDAVAGTSLNDR